jgi:hypothetical protein
MLACETRRFMVEESGEWAFSNFPSKLQNSFILQTHSSNGWDKCLPILVHAPHKWFPLKDSFA